MIDLTTKAVTAATEAVTGKPFYESKTLWVNVIAIMAMMIQMRYGFAISPEIQTLVLSLTNMLLRSVTKENIIWN